MKKFEFKLETLLKVRRDNESAARTKLMVAQHKLEEVEGRINNLNHEVDNVEEMIRRGQREEIDAAEIRANHDYLQLVRRRLADEQDALMHAKNEVAIERQAVAQAMKERKVIENLKEKQYAEWEQQVREAERAFLDEQATLRYFHDSSRSDT